MFGTVRDLCWNNERIWDCWVHTACISTRVQLVYLTPVWSVLALRLPWECALLSVLQSITAALVENDASSVGATAIPDLPTRSLLIVMDL